MSAKATAAAVATFRESTPEATAKEISDLVMCQNPYDVAHDADALLLVTEWNEFKSLDFKQVKDSMKGEVILDGRNIWDPEDMREMGFNYYGIGLPHPED